MLTEMAPQKPTGPNPAVRAFCVGQAKSGTASLYGLLAANYRAAHEPEREQTLDLILRESRGELGEDEIRDLLIQRDHRLDLEYDIAWANQFLISPLVEVFPNARFIVLVRDCSSWLGSIVGHLLNREIPADVRNFLDWWFKPERYPHTIADRGLEENGVYSVSAFLHAWNDHVERCLITIPENRRLVQRCDELDRSHDRLADFLGIPSDRLDSNRGHLNSGAEVNTLGSMVESASVDEMIDAICGVNMARYFPEIHRCA